MSWHYLQEPAGDYSPASCLDIPQLATSNGTTTDNGSLPNASPMESCPTRLSSAISEHSSVTGTPQHIRAWLMLSRQASHASHSQSPETEPAQTTNETCGPKPLNAFASLDPDTACWRTFQVSFLTGTTAKYSKTWHRWGTMRTGVCYRLAPLVRHIHGKDCSYWPTPTKSDAGGGASAKEARRALAGETRASGHKVARKLGHFFALRYGTQPRPIFWDWMMGWVPNWSALQPLETDKYLRWLQQHGICCDRGNEE